MVGRVVPVVLPVVALVVVVVLVVPVVMMLVGIIVFLWTYDLMVKTMETTAFSTRGCRWLSSLMPKGNSSIEPPCPMGLVIRTAYSA